MIGFTELLIIALVMVPFLISVIIPLWRIYQRTGQSGAMSLLQWIPVVNVVMPYVLAFGQWPIDQERGNPSRTG